MKVLVTGGAGFIGSSIVERLLQSEYSVSVLDTLDPQVHGTSPTQVTSKAEFSRADVRDRSMLAEALEGADAVIHCAATVGVAQSLYRVGQFVDVNVGGTALLLELLAQRKRPLKRLIVLTSNTSYGEGLYRRPSDNSWVRVGIRSQQDISEHGWDPVCPETGEVLAAVPTPESSELLARNVYALTKKYQEELSFSLGEVYGFPVVCLRLFNVYGPGQSLKNPYTGVLAVFLSRLLAGQAPVIYEDGNQTRDFVSVHDVVDTVLLTLESEAVVGEVLNIGSGIPRRIIDCARTLAQLAGGEKIEPDITNKFRKGDIRHCTADISKAKKLLGYQPRVQWEEGLAELAQWGRSAGWEDHFDQAQAELRERGLLD